MVSKKKLAIVISGDFPEGNTKNARLKIIAKELVEHGWESTFLSSYPTRFGVSIGETNIKKWENFRIVFFSLSRSYWKPKILRILQVLISHCTILLWTLFRAHRYDAFYYYNPRFTDTLVSMILQRFFGRKVIVDQTELFSSQKNRKYHEVEERIIAKYPSVLFVISKPLLTHYQRMRNKQLYLFPILINTQRFDSIECQEQSYMMGYIGSFAAKDGVDLLMDAVSRLYGDIPQIKLRLIGYNPNEKQLEKLCNELGISEYVEITGSVSYNEIPLLLNECDTLLMNRTDSSFATYGYPIKLGEYFACNKPVIMSDGAGFSKDFDHKKHVYKYKADNVESLVEILKYRYHNEEESQKISATGYTYAKEKFDSRQKTLFLADILNKA